MCRHIILVVCPCAILFAEMSEAHAQGSIRDAKNSAARRDVGNIAASMPPNLIVSKTAQVSGEDVCGVIRITNLGMATATVASIADAIEVHFFNNVPPPGLTGGSTPNWFKLAEIPIPLPSPIAPRATATINYCFSLCKAADYPGANSMRNAVAVKVANPPSGFRTFPALSNVFSPPTLDCRACCLPDGSCADTVPTRCSSAGGLPNGPNTDCATSICTQACCLGDGTCSDKTLADCGTTSGEPSGLGTTCATANTTCRGACCSALGCGDAMTKNECGSPPFFGTYMGNDTTCAAESATCVTGACCQQGFCVDHPSINGFSFHLSRGGCESINHGTYLGDGSTCTPTSCTEACCVAGVCQDLSPSQCTTQGGTALGSGTTCATANTTCRGACCSALGCGDAMTKNECGSPPFFGTYMGNDTTCAAESATCVTGACCQQGFCVDHPSINGFSFHLSRGGCESTNNGTYLGDGTTCTASSCE